MRQFLKRFAHDEMVDPTIRGQLQILDFKRYLAEFGRLPDPLHSDRLPEPYKKHFLRFLTLGQKFLLDEIATTTKLLQRERQPTVTFVFIVSFHLENEFKVRGPGGLRPGPTSDCPVVQTVSAASIVRTQTDVLPPRQAAPTVPQTTHTPTAEPQHSPSRPLIVKNPDPSLSQDIRNFWKVKH